MEGWISLHRKFLDWEWYSDINTKALFLHCLLRANHKSKNWRGIDIKKGQFVTSLKHLSSETGLSIQQIRTCLNKLKSTNEVTSKTTNLNTLISICNWDKYQDDNKQNNKPSTNKQQTNNKQITTNNNDNNDNNDNNINIEFDVFWDLYDKKRGRKEDIEYKWLKLNNTDRQLIIDYIPKYKLSQPNKKFRKDPSTFLNQKSWNDELIHDGSHSLESKKALGSIIKISNEALFGLERGLIDRIYSGELTEIEAIEIQKSK